MSVISPPEPNLDTFNNTYWTTDDIPLTQAEANKLYLKYPIAQGTQTLQAVNINGITTINETTTITNSKNLLLTDGTTTNTISHSGYTTRNSVQNLTHYLNFSDSSSTGIGNIQKTAGISCNPFTNNITATSFTGNASNAIAVSTTNTNASSPLLYLVGTQPGAGDNKTLYGDYGTTPLTYNAFASTLTAVNFDGNATTATTATNANGVLITSDNTAGTYYIPFAKTSGTGNKPLFFDDATTPLTFNPSTVSLGINSSSIAQPSGSGDLTISNTSTIGLGGNINITPSTSASAAGNINLTTSTAPTGGNITISALGAQGTNGNLTLATRSGTPALNRGFILNGAATLAASATAAASVDLVLTINGVAYRVALKAIA
jgi:hypothetical protein